MLHQPKIYVLANKKVAPMVLAGTKITSMHYTQVLHFGGCLKTFMFLALENQLSDHYATIEASFLIHGLRVHNIWVKT
jgi:hypothetical protein